MELESSRVIVVVIEALLSNFFIKLSPPNLLPTIADY